MPLYGGPFEELPKLSALPEITEQQLLHGEIYSERGREGSFPRGAYAESCYFVKAPLASVGGTLLHWDPSRYKETEVCTYTTYSWPTGPDVFNNFRLTAGKAGDRSLIEWTSRASNGEQGTLHLTKADAEAVQRLRSAVKGSSASDGTIAWQGILRQWDGIMAGGGLAGLPSYLAGGTKIRALDEYKNLLKMTPTIAAHFAALTGARPLFSDSVQIADEAVPYAEQSDVNGHNSFCLGVLAARKGAEGWQVLDCSYYTADTYFISLALYQLWPWKDGTLVWEIDYVSAPFRSYLGGVDRLIAGKQLSKESTQAIRLFRRVAEGQMK